MNREFKDALEDSPVIAAIKDEYGLKECLKSDIRVVFILYRDICNIADIVDAVKQTRWHWFIWIWSMGCQPKM